MSELIVDKTIVAAGTSLPEVATSVMAALRGERGVDADRPTTPPPGSHNAVG